MPKAWRQSGGDTTCSVLTHFAPDHSLLGLHCFADWSNSRCWERTMRRLIVLMFSIFAVGCATPYYSGKFSFTGGYFNKPVTPELEKICFYGNGFTSGEKAKQYTLFRSAEFARDQNKPCFLLYPSLNNAAQDKPGKMPTVGSVGGKPGAICYVLLLDDERQGAIETTKIIAQLEGATHE